MDEAGNTWGRPQADQPEPLPSFQAETPSQLLERLVKVRVDSPARSTLLTGQHLAITERGITQATAATYDYLTVSYRGIVAHAANYRDASNKVVAQHVRTPAKEFVWVGRKKEHQLQLFGQHLGDTGTLVITEGEIDAMSVHQMVVNGRMAGLSGQWTVVSIPDGAASAEKALERHLQWIEGFSRVIVFFDQDDPGRQAAAKVMALLDRAQQVERFPYKDANEAWMAGDGKAITDALLSARRRAPEHILAATSITEQIFRPTNRMGQPFPWAGWNKLTFGMKPGELWMISGGTGIGKSLFTRSICLHLLQSNVKCAYVGLEESAVTTVERMLSEALGFDPPFHLDTEEERARRDPKVIQQALDSFAPNLMLMDSFGEDNFDAFVAAVRHYVLAEGCRYLFLDHFSFLADGIALGTDQRRAIDQCIKKLKTLCVKLNFTMVVVCHLSRGDGLTPHEEGGEPHLGQLRGSHSLSQVPDYVVMLQRNPRAEDPAERNITTCWLKKNRPSGELGMLNRLHFLPSCRFYELPQ